jgi:hypothetical protein
VTRVRWTGLHPDGGVDEVLVRLLTGAGALDDDEVDVGEHVSPAEERLVPGDVVGVHDGGTWGECVQPRGERPLLGRTSPVDRDHPGAIGGTARCCEDELPAAPARARGATARPPARPAAASRRGADVRVPVGPASLGQPAEPVGDPGHERRSSSGRRRTVDTQASSFQSLTTREPPSTWDDTRTPRPPPRWSAIQWPGAAKGVVIP